MSMFSTCRLHPTTGSPVPGICRRVTLSAGWCQPGPAPRLLAWPHWASADAQGYGVETLAAQPLSVRGDLAKAKSSTEGGAFCSESISAPSSCMLALQIQSQP